MTMQNHRKANRMTTDRFEANRGPRAKPSLGSFRMGAIPFAVSLLCGAVVTQAAQPGVVLQPGTVPIKRAEYGAAVRDPVPIAGGQYLRIDQKTDKAIIEWDSFNIARGSTVEF
jgi:hypothetical protein